MSNIVSEVKSVPDTFTSWDKCMSKAYCKWPAIVGIVVGSLILLSLIWCFARCLCCGAELCSCCGSCCRGGRRREKPSKCKDDYTRMPAQSAPYQGYQPMAYGHPNTPQFATFDDPSQKKINEDSLPPMPSWDTATTKRVEDTSAPPPHAAMEDVEMGRLEAQPHTMRGGYKSVPNGPHSPISPYPQPDYIPPTEPRYAYDAQHPLDADLGVQRINTNPASPGNFQSVPLSPPPTYRTGSVTPSTASDRFIAGATSPSPEDYNRQHHMAARYRESSSYAPSMSTRYEPYTDYTSNAQQPPYYAPQLQAPPPGQPPFLQVGRKPLSGSYREV